jgi:hypothetical protein
LLSPSRVPGSLGLLASYYPRRGPLLAIPPKSRPSPYLCNRPNRGLRRRRAPRARHVRITNHPDLGAPALGAIPENVLLSARAIVIAGFANEVDAVNQYAAPIQAATRHAASLGPVEPMTTRINPAVATASDSHCAGRTGVHRVTSMRCTHRSDARQMAPTREHSDSSGGRRDNGPYGERSRHNGASSSPADSGLEGAEPRVRLLDAS